MSFDTPENLKTIFECIGILNEEINQNMCSRGGTEVFFKLMQLQRVSKSNEVIEQ